MPIGVLGPVDIGDHTLAPRERAVLAALVLRRGTTVSGDELAEAYWHGEPPVTWWQQVKTSVARIREAVGADAIMTVPGGYVFGLDPGVIDAVRFERLVEAARGDVGRDDAARAIDRFGHALSLWRAAPFPELQGWGPGVLETMRLTEVRASAEEELLAARLDAGETSSTISEAQRLVGNAPLREERWALLALANYRSGRQAEALAVLREARTGLDRELGITPGARLNDLATAMLRQDPMLSGRSGRIVASVECPYRGLAAFDADTADLYFGREADIVACLPRVRSGAVLAIVGPSGSGKSSLLHAGLLPAVRASGREIMVAPLGPRADVILRDRGTKRREDAVIAIDQFEEIFALDAELRDRVVSELVQLIARGAALVLTIRSDFLDAATRLAGLGTQIGRGVIAVAPLTAASLREAIERPARLAALNLEPGLVELILRDAGDRATALPHLSHVLVETWLRREGSTLTVDGYDAAGGLAGAIALSAEQRFRSFSSTEQDVCRTILLRLVDITEDGSAGRRRLSLSAVSEDPLRRVVVDSLVAARLLTVEADTVTVSHESIALAWPRLAEWLEANRESAELMRRLESSAAAWDDGGRPADELLRGPRLAATLAWRDETRPILSEVESAYLRDAADDEQTRAAQIAERARRDRRQNRMLRSLLAAAAGLLVVAIVAASVAIVRGQDAVKAETDAKIEALTATVPALLSSDRDAAALLAAELYRQYPHDARVRSALLAVAADPAAPVNKVSYPADERIFATPIPDTMNVLVARNRIGRIADANALVLEVRDMTTGNLVRTLPASLPAASTAFPGTMLVDPTGARALLAYPIRQGNSTDCCSTEIATVDLLSGRIAAGPIRTDAFIGAGGTFSADGLVAVLGEDGSENPVWIDPTTLAFSRSPEPGMDHSPAFGVASDGAILVGTPDRVDRRDPVTHAIRSSMALPGNYGSYAIRALDDGGFLSAGPAGYLRSDAAGRTLWAIRNNDCNSFVDRQAAGTFVCMGNSQGTISEYRLSDGIPSGRTFEVQAQWVMGIESLADGSIVAVNQRTAASLSRFTLDGSGPASHLVANGQIATGFVDERTIVVSPRTADPGNDPHGHQQLWDLATDAAAGSSGPDITPLGGGIFARWDGSASGYQLTRRGTSATWGLTSPDGAFSDGNELKLWPGATDTRAFAINSDWIVPFDPRTGAASGPRMNIVGEDLLGDWVMVHEVPGRDRAVVSWWKSEEARMVTSVFDLGTGRELARGLYGDVASVGLPNGRVASTSSSELRRSSDSLVPIDTLAKPVSGANQFELSRDGSLLLLQGSGQPANLYDVATGRKLGGNITTDSPGWGAAHLAPNGTTMLTNVAAGVLIWDLTPAHEASSVCHSVGRTLTSTEWRTYFGDAPQVNTCARLASPGR